MVKPAGFPKEACRAVSPIGGGARSCCACFPCENSGAAWSTRPRRQLRCMGRIFAWARRRLDTGPMLPRAVEPYKVERESSVHRSRLPSRSSGCHRSRGHPPAEREPPRRREIQRVEYAAGFDAEVQIRPSEPGWPSWWTEKGRRGRPGPGKAGQMIRHFRFHPRRCPWQSRRRRMRQGESSSLLAGGQRRELSTGSKSRRPPL